MDLDDYDVHSNLVEKFIVNCDKSAFRKMLNMNLNKTSIKMEKQKESIIKRKQFLKGLRTKMPQHPYFQNDNYYNNNYNNNFKQGDISNFKLDMHNFIRDPEYQNKCMRGNYKWANLKFQQMKVNLAKRKGIPVEDLKMPKIWTKKKSINMEMNGNNIKRNKNSLKKYESIHLKENTKTNYALNRFSKLKTKKISEGSNRVLSQKEPNILNIININS